MDALLQKAQQLAAQALQPYLPIENRVAYMVSHGQSYASNGYAIRTQGVAKALNGHGFDTLCFVRPGRPWELNTKIAPEVIVNGVRYIHSPWDNTAPADEISHLEQSVKRFVELFKVYRPSVVLAASNYIVALPAYIAAKQLGLPFYNEVRGFWELSRDAREPGYAQTSAFLQEAARDTFVAKQAEKVFTLNQPMKTELVKRGVLANIIHLVPNSVDTLPVIKPADLALKQKLGINNDEKVIGYIGSVNAYEGLDTLLGACAQLVAKGEKVKLLLVGDDQPLTATLPNKNRNKKIYEHPWVIQVGRVPHHQVGEYYALVDIIVVPRIDIDVCQLVPPLKVVEALSYKKQILVSDVVALKEYAEVFESVVAFDSKSSDALVYLLQKTLSSKVCKSDIYLEGDIKNNAIHEESDLLFSTATRYLSSVLKNKIRLNDFSSFKIKDIEQKRTKCETEVGKLLTKEFSNKPVSRVMVYTNLGLTTIDGSSVFIANVVTIYSHVFDEVYLLSVQDIGENFLERINRLNNLSIVRCAADNVRDRIFDLSSKLDFETIFVRGWGDRAIWFDKRYADKITYYWPLTEKPEKEDHEIFKSVGLLAFQTEELRSKTFGIMGEERSNILFPPLIGQKVKSQVKDLSGPLVISYIGTLRPECYSLDLLRSLLKVSLVYPDDVQINIAIGKIFYREPKERSEVLDLIEYLRSKKNVKIEEKVPQSRCDEILAKSAISFSLWEPNLQNILQISTKMLDCLSSGVNVICFKTELHKKYLGDNYKFYISDVSELESKVFESIDAQISSRRSFSNNYSLSFFSKAWHVANVARVHNKNSEEIFKYQRDLFCEQFDKIYGVYVNESEKGKLEYLVDNCSLNIHLFKGVNGRVELNDQYEYYKSSPLLTAWELRAKKKRLTIGAMGHLATFIKIAKEAIDNDYNKILILEADVLFHNEVFSLNSQSRPFDFKVWYLGAGKWNDNLTFTSDGKFYKPHETTGTFAVALDISVLKELLAEWEAFIEPTDVAMWPVTNRHLDDSFVSLPNLAICDVATSLTGSGRSQKAISERFGWKLNSYNLSSVEKVNKYFDKVLIEFDYVLPDAEIILHCQNGTVELGLHGSAVCICVNDVLDKIEHRNVFLKDIKELA